MTQAKEGDAGPERQRAYELATANSHQPNTQSAGASERLKAIRNKFTTEGLRRNSKAEATFTKHSSYNERFILHLYDNKPEILHPEFARALDDVAAEIDYSTVENRHR